MNQIESFRHVLGLPEPSEEKAVAKMNGGDAGKSADALEGQDLSDVKPPKVRKVKKKGAKKSTYGRSVSIKPDTYAELKALLFWASRENLLDGGTMDALFKALIQSYCERNPAAKAFVNKNS